jgi:hypothetical protein
MKSRSLTPLILIVSFAAGILVIGAIILIRRPSWLESKVQSKPYPRYPHEHLPSSEWEAGSKLAAVSYKLQNGETLAVVAKLRYGHQNYHRIIRLFNHIDDVDHIEVGTELRVPDMSSILAEEGFTKVAQEETKLILCSRAKYDRVVHQLWALREHADASYPVPERVRQELLEAADDLEQATENLKTGRPGVIRPPLRLIGQLEQAMWGMRDLAEGAHADPNGYDIDIVSQRYALALEYAIVWARDGFT